jgi:anti-sigma factor RsiW
MWFVGHGRVRGAVERFVDGEASLSERARVVAHLRQCRRCRRAALFLVELRSALRRRRRRAPVMLGGARVQRWVGCAGELESWPTST